MRKKNYNISEIDFINVFCLDGSVNLLFVSLSNVIVVALLVNDDNVRWRDIIGGSINRLLGGTIAVDVNSSLSVNIKSSITGGFTEDWELFWFDVASSTSLMY